ncbi:MAG: T9SS type A sorting domain-containing protein, partial [bacterium]
QRLSYAEPYVYAACAEAGIAIFEVAQTGVNEPVSGVHLKRPALTIVPNPTSGPAILRGINTATGNTAVAIRDVSGREVRRVLLKGGASSSHELDLSGLRPGVYFLELLSSERRTETIKLVRQ